MFMLSKEYSELVLPVIIEPKIDGLRVGITINKDTNEIIYYTRSGKILSSLEHLSYPLRKFLSTIDACTIFLDTEVSCGTFKKTMQEVRKKKLYSYNSCSLHF